MTMFETLGRAMGPRDRMSLTCLACGRAVSWSREQALAAFGEFAPPWHVRDRARCGACGERERVRVTL